MALGTLQVETREATAATLQRIVALLNEIKRQSRPRRWFWQEKTIRDLIDEGRADLVEVALAKSTALAAAAAQRRDELRAEVGRFRPARWSKRKKSPQERVADQSMQIAEAAIERATVLVDAARTKRERLIAEARRQSQPRRWRWQKKTLRDTFDERAAAIGATVVGTVPAVRETAREAASRVQHGFTAAPHKLGDVVGTATGTVKETTQHVAHRVVGTADTAVSTVREAGEHVARRVGGTAGSAATSVKSVAMVPVEASKHAVSETVESGKRSVRRGVRLVRALMWGLLIGIAIGTLLAPRPGEETRRNLQDLWDSVLNLFGDANA